MLRGTNWKCYVVSVTCYHASTNSSSKRSTHRKFISCWENHLLESIKNLDGTQTDDHGHVIYLNLCDFQSSYLDHIDEEDVQLEEVLQQHFTDEELIQHQIEIMKQMEFSTLLLWFKYIVPARRTDENAQVIRNFKANAPKEAVDAVLNTIQAELSDEEFSLLMQAIEN